MTDYVQGIDISKWQDANSTPEKFDFTKAYNKGARFVIIKASQGVYTDEDFEYNWKAAKAAGLLRGAYHFMDWWQTGTNQGAYFANLLLNDPPEIGAWMDYECRHNMPGAGRMRQWLKDALEILKAWDLRAGIYTGPSYWLEFGSTDAYWKQYPLWIANYTTGTPIIPKPWTAWTFWQYSARGDGKSYGSESLDLDMDYFNGSAADLYKWAGFTAPDPEPVPTSWAAAIDAWARERGYTGPGPE